MIAIVLAAGEGTRLKPITNTIPKALVEVAGKSLLEYNLDTIYRYVEEIIIIVKYKWEKIKEKIWTTYKWVKVTYHTQGEEKWTGGALKWVYRNNDILILYSDAIISMADVKKVIKHKGFATLWMRVKDPKKYGIFKTDTKWNLQEIIEKPQSFIWNLANFSFFKVDTNIFRYIEGLTLSVRGEFELTDAINEFVKQNKMAVIEIRWPLYDITKEEDIIIAQEKIQKENKKYTVKELTKKEFLKQFDSFIETLENLKPSGGISKKRLKKFFELSIKQWPTFVAVKKDGEVIGSIKVLIEAKLIRGGQYAGKIEDFAVKKWFEGLWIGSKLIKKALTYCNKKEVYKVTLSCRENLLPFYEKFGFEKYSTNMKIYIKK